MLGIISSAIVIGLMFTIVIILINSGVLYYLTHLLEFEDKKYRSAIIVSIIIGIINFVLSIIAALIKTYPLLLETIGVAVYVVVVYFAIGSFYKETKKARAFAAVLMTLFGFALSFLAMNLITFVFNTLKII